MAVPVDGTHNRPYNLIQMDESGFFTLPYIGNMKIQLTPCIILNKYFWRDYCLSLRKAQHQYIAPNMKVKAVASSEKQRSFTSHHER
jgi:hypothetical protein